MRCVVFAPIFAYFLLETPAPVRARDIALGIVGNLLILGLNYTGLVAYVAVALAQGMGAKGFEDQFS